MRSTTDEVLDTLAAERELTAADREETAEVVRRIERILPRWDIELDAQRHLALAAHSLAFVRRIRSGERLPDIDADLVAEADPDVMAAVRRALAPFCEDRGADLEAGESFLFSTHIEVARFSA
ncbi:hypothetical protein [Georgenia deserti]|uniref:PRD domain-containing protein n=1 Tax=Georgenia deserti TaxID=2093781 RepID=A0ABW4L3B3_9MICO